jgi:hypothetical protein
MNATKTIHNTMSPEDRKTVEAHYLIYRNTGTVCTGLWVYQPHDFDSPFELWSEGYKTMREAYQAALRELPMLHEMNNAEESR